MDTLRRANRPSNLEIPNETNKDRISITKTKNRKIEGQKYLAFMA